MITTKCNYKGSYQEFNCPGCETHLDTTEHLFECWITRYITGVEVDLDAGMTGNLSVMKDMAYVVKQIME